MNDRRICQLLLIPFTISYLFKDPDDRTTRRVGEYVGLITRLILPRDRQDKLAKRTTKWMFEIMDFFYVKGRCDRSNVVLSLFHLAQLIFDDKNFMFKKGNKNFIFEKEHFFMKRIKFILQFILKRDDKERANDNETQEEFNKINRSAKKKAVKIFDNYYKQI